MLKINFDVQNKGDGQAELDKVERIFYVRETTAHTKALWSRRHEFYLQGTKGRSM
jgi:hypothetical protein